MSGLNPLRWKCLEEGCFNLKRRPKIEVLNYWFGGKIKFGDVDGIVEINEMGLLLEWKAQEADDLIEPQERMYTNLSKSGILTCLCIQGNAQTMEPTQYRVFRFGIDSGWQKCDKGDIGNQFSDLMMVIHDWAEFAGKGRNVVDDYDLRKTQERLEEIRRR